MGKMAFLYGSLLPFISTLDNYQIEKQSWQLDFESSDYKLTGIKKQKERNDMFIH